MPRMVRTFISFDYDHDDDLGGSPVEEQSHYTVLHTVVMRVRGVIGVLALVRSAQNALVWWTSLRRPCV